MPTPPPEFPIAVLLSGGGRTLENLLRQGESGDWPIAVRLVVSSHTGVRGLEVARNAGIAARVIAPQAFSGVDDYSRAVFDACRDAEVRLVAMAGFIRYVTIPEDFALRVTNIHPSLIPSFCGRGFYGGRVHRAAIEYGVKVSGCTVHFVDNEYDHGPIILQKTVPVEPDDTEESLAIRVFQAECAAYPEALRAIAEDRVRVDGRRVVVEPQSV